MTFAELPDGKWFHFVGLPNRVFLKTAGLALDDNWMMLIVRDDAEVAEVCRD